MDQTEWIGSFPRPGTWTQNTNSGITRQGTINHIITSLRALFSLIESSDTRNTKYGLAWKLRCELRGLDEDEMEGGERKIDGLLPGASCCPFLRLGTCKVVINQSTPRLLRLSK
jgi:hypothetical protein